ncbi:MAG: ABC-three component system middle component 2 [Mesorhizobium sp.]
MTAASQTDLFNGVLETGMRSVVVLNAFSPIQLDREELSLLDYFIVHSSQAGGPEDIHPTKESSFSEYHVRRRRIDDGIKMLIRIRLVDVVPDPDRGLCFRAGDDAPGFVDLLRSSYNRDLVHRALWLRARHDEDAGFLARLRQTIERWVLEFQQTEAPGGAR